MWFVVFLSVVAANPLFNNLAYPPSPVEIDRTTPVFNAVNVGKTRLNYCIIKDAIMWHRSKTRMYSDATRFVLDKLASYTGLVFIENLDDCDLKYNFAPYEGKSAGVFYNHLNLIKVQTNIGLSIWDNYKLIMHETLHALGLNHNTESKYSIMQVALDSSQRQLIYLRDVSALNLLWGPRAVEGHDARELDYYEQIMMSDARYRPLYSNHTTELACAT